jgi:hypothetical protein
VHTVVTAHARQRPHVDRAARRRIARERLILLSKLMDSAVELPGLRTRIGLDAVLGVVPVVGDLLSAGIGLFLIAEARELGASRWLQAKMLGNLLTDVAIGAVPLVGDVADVYFKAHLRNLKLLQKELGEPFVDAPAADGAPRQRDRSRDGMR